MEANEPTPPPFPKAAKTNWFIFFGVLVAPAIVTLLVAGSKATEGLAMAAPLIGGGIAGIVSGIMLAKRMNRPTGAKVAFGVLFAVLFGFFSFALGFVGCMVGGFKMDFR